MGGSSAAGDFNMRLGTLKGTGVLVVGQQRFDPVTYWFDVDLEDGVRSASGKVSGDRHGLDAFAKASTAQLQMQDGTIMHIQYTERDAHGAKAVVVGRIPGY
jgi:hypothetical protein